MIKMISLSFGLMTLLFNCNTPDNCDNDALKLTSFEKDKSYCLDDKLSFTMESLNDSRCPLDVVCVWAGNVVIDVKFSGSAVTDTTFSYQKNVQDKFTFKGYEFQIDSITPYPVDPNDNEPLTVHMHVVK